MWREAAFTIKAGSLLGFIFRTELPFCIGTALKTKDEAANTIFLISDRRAWLGFVFN